MTSWRGALVTPSRDARTLAPSVMASRGLQSVSEAAYCAVRLQRYAAWIYCATIAGLPAMSPRRGT
jgi:hypothetical protein